MHAVQSLIYQLMKMNKQIENSQLFVSLPNILSFYIKYVKLFQI